MIQQRWMGALEGNKPVKTTDEEQKVMERKAISTIQLCREFTKEIMEDPRRVVYGKVANKVMDG